TEKRAAQSRTMLSRFASKSEAAAATGSNPSAIPEFPSPDTGRAEETVVRSFVAFVMLLSAVSQAGLGSPTPLTARHPEGAQSRWLSRLYPVSESSQRSPFSRRSLGQSFGRRSERCEMHEGGLVAHRCLGNHCEDP